MELKGKRALVTGAARGIGRGIALKLGAAGVNLALVDLGRQADPGVSYNLAAQSDLIRTVEEARALGVATHAIHADVTSFADCRRMAEEAVAQLGGLDILCNNAGIIAVGKVADTSEETWDKVMAVNAKGPFLCAKACIPYLLRNREGAIVNIASVAGKTARARVAAYCASKFAVIALTQSLAEELGPSNIRVNAVCPGYLRTAMWTDVLNKVVPQFFGVSDKVEPFDGFVARHTYLRREQTPDDIGEAVAYLCRADNVTGISLTVAGGGEVH